MHSKKTRRWLKLSSAVTALVALAGFALTAPSQAVSPNPTPYCSEGTCWVTFDYSGDSFIWTPPSKINSLHFDVLGAQGGRSGGKGGSVSGDFAVIPSMLYVFVGGAGSSSNGAPGGFNGGGASGNGHGDQGSGGGASDLRISPNLSDRVVVAGGGGGTGGWIGGVGGAGGLTIASAGTKGSPSGTAGGGGTQLAGGVAGLGVTTGNGTAGSLALGGVGGNGAVAGGGGGGGGFYGGGGGGSDSVSGGSDGAGGGGGSSFATMALTSSVVHQAGVRAGNGQVVLRYTFAPSVTSFSLTSGANSKTGTASYQITFDQLVYDLDPFDFKLSGTASGCTIGNPTGDGYHFVFDVVGCSSGTLNLSLRPWAVLGATAGPPTETFATGSVTMDNQPPQFTIASPPSPTNATVLNFQLSSVEEFNLPNVSAFELVGSGCQIGSITMIDTRTAQVQVVGCLSAANAKLRLLANRITDLSGNVGPTFSIYSSDVQVDREPPSIVSKRQVSTIADLTEFEVSFSESVTGLSLQSFETSGTCAFSKLDGEKSDYRVWLKDCGATATLNIKPEVARDAAGNLGPATAESAGGSADTVAPTATVTELNRIDKSQSPSFEIRFDELVEGFGADSLSRSGTAKNCGFTVLEETAGTLYRVDTADCTAGSLMLSLLSGSVTDTHGNYGPLVQVNSPMIRITESNVAVPTFNRSDTEPSVPLELSPSLRNQPQPSVIKPKSVTSMEEPRGGYRLETLKPESWVSLAIALAALAIVKRSRGRRAIRK